MSDAETPDARPLRLIGHIAEAGRMEDLVPASRVNPFTFAGIRFRLAAPRTVRDELGDLDRDTAQTVARFQEDLPLLKGLPHIHSRVQHLLGFLADVRAQFEDVTKHKGALPGRPPRAQVFVGDNVGGKCAPWHFDPHGDPHEPDYACAIHLRGIKLGVWFASASKGEIWVPVNADVTHHSRVVSDSDLQSIADRPSSGVTSFQQEEFEGVIFNRNGLHASSTGDGSKLRCMIK